ncbi:PREDICTED: zinc finger CCCH domain-containing protein 49-like [Fragaria vesca subsp. vesca]
MASDSPTSPNSPYLPSEEALSAALRRYLPSNNEGSDPDPDSPVDAYSGDHFRMFEFKVRRCARGRSHDWTDCPFAHPGEEAQRRDPRKFHYSGSACPDFRKGHCKKGDSCEFAHGVFECWLHPARYRTQPCKDGTSCKRRVCFFAHTPEQLRVLPQQSPRGSNSPPMTRSVSRSLGLSSVSEMVASLRKVKSLPTSWNVQVGLVGSVGSPGVALL